MKPKRDVILRTVLICPIDDWAAHPQSSLVCFIKR
jgi:hypothetical protein